MGDGDDDPSLNSSRQVGDEGAWVCGGLGRGRGVHDGSVGGQGKGAHGVWG